MLNQDSATARSRAVDAAELCQDGRHFALYPDTSAELTEAHVNAHQTEDQAKHEAEPAVPLEEALAGAEEKRAARKLAGEQAAGLRALAGMLEANPELSKFAHLDRLQAFHVNNAEDQAALARAALRHGAKVDKDITEDLHNLILRWGPVGALVLAWRHEVCERVVVGVEMVTETVPDPARLAEVPLIDLTTPVERVEWVCRPLLAAGDSAVGGA